jgi:hypothetical protein
VRKLVFILALAGGSCIHFRGGSGSAANSSCATACSHYTECRNLHDDNVHRACVRECQEIFVEDGVVDRQSLREFQDLECPDAVAFVEGSSGRPPGAN